MDNNNIGAVASALIGKTGVKVTVQLYLRLTFLVSSPTM